MQRGCNFKSVIADEAGGDGLNPKGQTPLSSAEYSELLAARRKIAIHLLPTGNGGRVYIPPSLSVLVFLIGDLLGRLSSVVPFVPIAQC